MKNHPQQKKFFRAARVERGVSLIELLVALVISALLIFGATQIYVDSRNTYTINETSARMQETARYALNVLEPDMRMSNYWGLVKGADIVSVTGGSLQSEAANTAIGGNAATTCGTNYALDLQTNIQANDAGFALGDSPSTSCAGKNPAPFADTLTIRRAAAPATPGTSVAPVANTLQLCTSRLGGSLFKSDGSASSCAASPAGLVTNLIVNGYYVSRDSDQALGLPSLRRYRLVAGPDFSDEEVIQGVEDLQIQYGIDTDGGARAVQYVDPPSASATTANPTGLPAGTQIVSIRLWFLVRSDTPEVGFTDSGIYEYGSRLASNGTTGDLTATADAAKAYQPSKNGGTALTSVQHYRRLLISRTIQLRNALGT